MSVFTQNPTPTSTDRNRKEHYDIDDPARSRTNEEVAATIKARENSRGWKFAGAYGEALHAEYQEFMGAPTPMVTPAQIANAVYQLSEQERERKADSDEQRYQDWLMSA